MSEREQPLRSQGQEGASMSSEKYADLTRLAEWFRITGSTLRDHASLAPRILAAPEVADSAELSRDTWREVEESLRPTGAQTALEAHALELDLDALAVRATVLTYEWIDDLQALAERTLGSVAARAVGYLAPEVALGGPIVSAGLIETGGPDRDDLAAYLNELAETTPELLQHFVSGGGGLVEALHLRAMLTVPQLAGDDRATVARGGMQAIGAEPFTEEFSSALRDIAGGYVAEAGEEPLLQPAGEAAVADRPETLAALVQRLTEIETDVFVQPVGGARFLVFLTGGVREAASMLLSDGDLAADVASARATIDSTLDGIDGARLLVAGLGRGGLVAAALATDDSASSLPIDQVITAGSPAAQATDVPVTIPVLALEDRSDPVALLGSLLNASLSNRLTVVFDGGEARGSAAYVHGAELADRATHSDVAAALQRLRELGYLTL